MQNVLSSLGQHCPHASAAPPHPSLLAVPSPPRVLLPPALFCVTPHLTGYVPSDETHWTILKNLRSEFRFNLILSSSALFFQLHCIASSLAFLTILPLNAHTDQFVNSFHHCERGRRKMLRKTINQLLTAFSPKLTTKRRGIL